MFETTIKNITLQLDTNDEVFSPKSADKGTLAMLEHVNFTENDKVLDLGCGCGIVGILSAKIIGENKVFMCDISENAVALSKANAEKNNVEKISIVQSDGLKNVTESGFTLILSNPPYHTDFSVAKAFIEKGFNRLAIGGRMFMVTKRLDWYKNKLSAIFGGVKVYEHEGYFVFEAEKRKSEYANIKPKKEKTPPTQKKGKRR